MKNIEFEELGTAWTKEDLLEAVPNARTVPQIFLNDEFVGGYYNNLQERLKYVN